MKFASLRLSGFKSFVEPTELEIMPGLTGVVGPNGCGKSNLLEALRWVMGESSYKSMRASGMDDVIFSGTAKRPARNMAEVVVTLDNSDFSAPPAFNNAETLEVSRRIEREAGSAYRINGNDTRARDVQLLFADASTGARSPALVRQGQISELISAKPQSRRKILEEAAGISGLHTRRHEAELKLRGAETNLTRLDDVVAQLESQLNALRRQARQAIRYKHVSAEIRQLEAAGLYSAWKESAAAVEKIAGELNEVTRILAGFTRAVSEKTRNRDKAAEALPKLRENETVRIAVLQRLTIEREGLEREESEAKARRAELEGRLAQIERDLARESEILADVDEAVARLDSEAQTLEKAQGSDDKTRKSAATALQKAADDLATAQQKADETAATLSEMTASRRALERSIADVTARLEKLKREHETIAEKRKKALAATKSAAETDRLAKEVEKARLAAQQAAERVAETEARLAGLREAETEARKTHDEARARSDKLTTEVRTLTKLLNVNDDDLWPPVIDALSVDEGYETALGAALGDDLDVPADEASPVHWRLLAPLESPPALPGNARPLSDFVRAPAELSRRLSQIGIVEAGDAPALQKQLKAGQRLVSRDGGLWRWDGLCAPADAPTAAAKRLAERNRLGSLQAESEKAQRRANETRELYQAARAAVAECAGLERNERQAVRAAASALEEARARLAATERAMSEQMQQISALEEAGRRVGEAVEQASAQLAGLKEEFAGLPDAGGLEQKLASQRAKVTEARNIYAQIRARHDGLEREARLRQDRLRAIEAEKASWSQRTERARAQIGELEKRRKTAASELEKHKNAPDMFEARRVKIMNALTQAEAERKTAGDELAVAEIALRKAEEELRTAERELGRTREEQARLEARLEAAREKAAYCEGRIAENLQCAPDEVIEKAGLEAENLPGAEEIEQKLNKLRNQRERLGAVNLRAETEATEVSEKLDELVSEREDVISAVNKLRHGIGALNKEGRQRLLEAFDIVNENFTSLFSTLFNGGKAELKLVESDDPLEAGLEIIANPPGKRPQVLSLLSGGEQALTALALIFAVFLTNPSPICVLDEVDAPLDDHNVERFCNLLDAMLEKSETRFLIITHHALTMSRMNRLFGVTMMERGVSQLVSVDLETAERMREAV